MKIHNEPRPVSGMRIRLIKGMDNGKLPYMGWCAGNVPVGTEGTVYEVPLSPIEQKYHDYHIFAVKWDGIEPQNNSYFGIGVIDAEYYEVIQPDPVCTCGKTSEGICPRCGNNMEGKQ